MAKLRYDRTIDVLHNNVEAYINNYYKPEKRIVLFGTSIIMGVVIAFLKKFNAEPEFIVDNSKNKQGRDAYGLHVYSPDILADDYDDNYVVIIASAYQNEMQSQLEQMGYQYKENIIKIIDLPQMANSYDLETPEGMEKLSVDEYKAEMLRVLVKFDEVCKKHNLRYYLYAGTFLGAVRHQGFIPWDDDVDVLMEIRDMKKLAEIMKKDKDFQFLCMFDDSEFYSNNALFYSTKYVSKVVQFPVECEIGVSIDVFPLIGVPENYEEILKYMNEYQQRESECWRYFYDKEMLKEKINELFHYLCKYEFEMAKNVNTTDNGGIANIVPQRYYVDTTSYKFEGYDLIAPRDYDYILKKLYGDYMVLPPVEKRIGKHFLNAYKSKQTVIA